MSALARGRAIQLRIDIRSICVNSDENTFFRITRAVIPEAGSDFESTLVPGL